MEHNGMIEWGVRFLLLPSDRVGDFHLGDQMKAISLLKGGGRFGSQDPISLKSAP